MMAGREVTRHRIVEAAYRLFRRKGFLRSGVDEIAAAAGVTKRTLYAHFASKDRLLEDVMSAQAEIALSIFSKDIARGTGSARQIIEMIFDDMARWVAKPRWSGSGYSRLAMELADLPGHPGRRIARAHKADLERLFASTLAEAGVRDAVELARRTWLLCEGALTMMVIHGDPAYVRSAAEAAIVLLEHAEARQSAAAALSVRQPRRSSL
jgi:AcrR family transcriptional regulator